MDKQLFSEYSKTQRIEMLDSNCDDVEVRTYFEKLTDEELTERKSRFAQKSIEIARIEDNKKEAVAEFKEQLTPLTNVNKVLLTEIKTGHAEKHGKVFKIVDHETKMVGFYSEAGTLVEQRPATEDESRQLTIASSRRKVSNE